MKDLFERRRVEDEIDAGHRVMNAVVVAHIADVEFQPIVADGDGSCPPASSRRGSPDLRNIRFK